jgi:Alpha amylase, catalytic domain
MPSLSKSNLAVQDDAGTEVAEFKRSTSQFPSLYQVNTRALIQEITRNSGRSATLDDISDGFLDHLSKQHFDWVWFLGVWQTGVAGQSISRKNEDWQREFRETLPDLTDEDVCGSCFAITDYVANRDFGGNAALDRLRDRVHRRGMKLLLDFVPNHTALDHPWVTAHPEFYVHGNEEQLREQPRNYIRMECGGKPAVLAFGRDPYFAGWPDTLQLNYAEPALQQAMLCELKRIAQHCDGVRCDMAMLILPEVFDRTWGKRPEPFWTKAIESVREGKPGFMFMAEVYWDLEWTLQQQGFTYTYDKRLYDRLRDGHARPVRDHFRADINFQTHSARFLENHDEPRAAAVFPPDMHRAAAVLTFLCPGLRFFHDGQFEGRTKKVPVHLGRRPDEAVDRSLHEFYEHLLACVGLPEVRDGAWNLLDCTPAWDGNWTADCFICFAWNRSPQENLIVVVNYAANQSQCYVRLPFGDLAGHSVLLQDLMGHEVFERDGTQLTSGGLYLDMESWGYRVFRVTQSGA